MALAGQLAGPLEAEDAHVCALPVALVRPLRLPERFLVPGHVEDVVDDLEEDAQLRCETGIRHCRRLAHGFQSEYAGDRRADQSAGLELVQVAQALGVQIRF